MKLGDIGNLLKEHDITTSAPCRIDFGGTLDISTFHYPLRHLAPCTVNIAVNRRTSVRLRPFTAGRIRISSTGIADAVFDPATAPYNHPLGLMFAVADCFDARGVHVQIHSDSPPRSGLGGSSVAAVALIAAFSKVLGCMGRPEPCRDHMALLAHAIEQGVAGVPCGLQDQLAATFGGVNRWNWSADPERPPYTGDRLAAGERLQQLNRHLLVAYLGVTHVSANVNRTWIRQFIEGKERTRWREIVSLTHRFADALARWDMSAAVDAMIRETAMRKAMTPDVLDEMGDRLAKTAREGGCGARFTGAGGGGCLWAIGEADAVAALKTKWTATLAERPSAGVLDCGVDDQGVC
ncbi:MAG: galactokinase [Desulfosarcina sp.]